ncbi:fumarylacetoacetate hydrolase family protein [Nocardioides sp. LMS-CY]|uniref:fumarylacetoacetate hydrolase family protein n=1 Tax=Nocardioides sp. (strain LMS-CY) TaxID=2840457 RepID=UPI001BFFD9BE|nr:fumarylacetoacetate hydrolase family protein [Nocardioides sp. LMS-CY]QWF20993.1 fumarylacetoacetate hydrolase family protein [Nocardioides sp. LMS-CY]
MRIERRRTNSGATTWWAERPDGSGRLDLAQAHRCAGLDGVTEPGWQGTDLVGLLSDPDLLRSLRAAYDHALGHADGACVSDADGGSPPTPGVGLFDVPRKLLGVGLNFPSHIAEAQRAGEPVQAPAQPTLFAKVPTALAGDGEEIAIPAFGTHLDYEVELAVVIGATCRDVPVERARDVIAGATVVNDLSLRDVLFHGPNGMFEGKNYDGFLPMASTFVTSDEVGDLDELVLESRVNGRIRQSERMGNALFSPLEIVSFASSRMTLQPGDVVFCGTPGGVGIFAEDPSSALLKPGDVVEASVVSLVAIRNVIGQQERQL